MLKITKLHLQTRTSFSRVHPSNPIKKKLQQRVSLHALITLALVLLFC